MTQTELLPRGDELEPEAIIASAADAAEGPIVSRVCLISGGGDSTVTAHRCREHYDELAFIDTGTALPGVRDFVIGFAASIGKDARRCDRRLPARLWRRHRGGREATGAPIPYRHMTLSRRARPVRLALWGARRHDEVLVLMTGEQIVRDPAYLRPWACPDPRRAVYYVRCTVARAGATTHRKA